MFGEQVGFNIQGNQKYQSYHGACLSLLVLMMLSAYGLTKLIVMIDYDDSKYQVREKEDPDVN